MGFDPVTALALGSAAIGAVGTLSGASARSSEANYQAQIARNNAIIEQRNATQEIQAGEQQATTQGLKNAAQLGKIKTQQAASGLDVNSGSAVDVRKGQAEVGALDTLTTLHNSIVKAYGYNAQASTDTAQAGLDTMGAQNDLIGGGLAAAGGLLGSASSLSTKWGSMQTPASPSLNDLGFGTGSGYTYSGSGADPWNGQGFG